VVAAAFLEEGGRTIDEAAPWPIRSCKGVENTESAQDTTAARHGPDPPRLHPARVTKAH
jgi:hypothetical protein